MSSNRRLVSVLPKLSQASRMRARPFHSVISVRDLSSQSGSLESKFHDMKGKVSSLKNDPGNEVKLKMYALFKQSTEGDNSAPKPSALNFVAKAKWDAWNNLKSLNKDDAMSEYIKIVQELVSTDEPTSDSETKDSESLSGSKYETVLYEVKNGCCKITLNRPQKYNAINLKCYDEIGIALEEAAKDDNVVVAALTGSGTYYSAGNDLSGFSQLAQEHGGDMQKGAQAAGNILEKFVSSFINFPKPLIGLINGPAVGISVTTLGLFDIVLASSNATFQTPFPSLGQTPEGCSSYTFAKLMGHNKATEMLLYEKKLTAVEAYDRNLVTEVIDQASFERVIEERLNFYASLPRNSLVYSKGLMRDRKRDKLMTVNREECDRLVERWTSEECISAIMKFMSRKQSKM